MYINAVSICSCLLMHICRFLHMHVAFFFLRSRRVKKEERLSIRPRPLPPAPPCPLPTLHPSLLPAGGARSTHAVTVPAAARPPPIPWLRRAFSGRRGRGRGSQTAADSEVVYGRQPVHLGRRGTRVILRYVTLYPCTGCCTLYFHYNKFGAYEY